MYLTRKTVWRKVRSLGSALGDMESVDTVELEPLADDHAPDADMLQLGDGSDRAKKKSKAEGIQNDCNSPIRKLRSALSLTNLMNLSLDDSDVTSKSKDKKEMKSIRYSSTVRVCLIPSRLDMDPLINELYWLPEDYVTFKKEAVTELKQLIKDLNLTAKAAISMLYQPSESDRASESDTLEDLENIKNPSPLSASAEDTGSQSDLKFLIGIKTDVEMNSAQNPGADSSAKDRTTKSLPSKTPSGAGSSLDSVWQATWTKYPQKA